MIALVPDQLKYINKTKRNLGIKFPIFQDLDNSIAKKLGIAFRIDKKAINHYKKFKINLNESQGNTKEELQMPGTYVIDRSERILFAYFDANYTNRVNREDVLATFLKKIKAQRLK